MHIWQNVSKFLNINGNQISSSQEKIPCIRRLTKNIIIICTNIVSSRNHRQINMHTIWRIRTITTDIMRIFLYVVTLKKKKKNEIEYNELNFVGFHIYLLLAAFRELPSLQFCDILRKFIWESFGFSQLLIIWPISFALELCLSLISRIINLIVCSSIIYQSNYYYSSWIVSMEINGRTI